MVMPYEGLSYFSILTAKASMFSERWLQKKTAFCLGNLKFSLHSYVIFIGYTFLFYFSGFLFSFSANHNEVQNTVMLSAGLK